MLEVLTPIAVIFTLVILNGLFVAAEFSLIASRRSRLHTLAGSGNGAARWLLGVFDRPAGKDRYIAIAQLGITLASIGLGMYGEPQIAKWLYGPFEDWGLSYAAAHTAGFVVALSLITFMHVVFGEMIPKALALQTPEAVSLQVNPLMRVFGLIFRPLVSVLNAVALGLMRLLGIKDPGKDSLLYTSKELSILTDETALSGQIGDVQRDLIQNIFALEEHTAEDLMTTRPRLEALNVQASVEEVTARIAASPRSRYPVFEDNLDQMIGVLHVKDFIRARAFGRSAHLGRLVRPLPHVAATATAEDLLAQFKRERIHAALVVDEFGGTLGFVTMDDLIEDVMEEEDTEVSNWVQANTDGSWTLDGEVTLSELNEHDLTLHSDDVNTVAGLLLAAYGTVPAAGTTVHVQGHDLTAEEVKGLKITRVRVRKIEPLV
ncbi:hemolysin family protein [Deinococcus aquatilis]|jgi:CBS domain containing-hemolysin-like protein|uniref:hemolysin family protein n=1 Tax=Deinococcus aquatilis TaxID=519440 RepID=UPI0003612FC2|nr:hemolysin family protein [Deinococcus aquatilis]